MRAVPPHVPKVPPGSLSPFNLAVATVDNCVVIQLQSTLILPLANAEGLLETLRAAISQAEDHVDIQVAGQIPTLIIPGGSGG